MSLAVTLLTAEDLLRMPRDDWRYELVEGDLRAGRIHELRRADFTPALAFLRH